MVGRWSGAGAGEGPGIEEKRRWFGRFVGLGGCESPKPKGEGDGEREMERWFEGRMRRMGWEEEEREIWRRKGMW